mmetsp:Transcript_61852/g.132991  ORF Transcript_61852/g.132991 Transcript_61852/m.132991 type:complete len:253 (+) Transcript_61852:353-1111(+)
MRVHNTELRAEVHAAHDVHEIERLLRVEAHAVAFAATAWLGAEIPAKLLLKELHGLRVLRKEGLENLGQITVPQHFAVHVQLRLQLLALLDLPHLGGLGKVAEALESIRPRRGFLRLPALDEEAADHPKCLFLASLALRIAEGLLRLLGKLRGLLDPSQAALLHCHGEEHVANTQEVAHGLVEVTSLLCAVQCAVGLLHDGVRVGDDRQEFHLRLLVPRRSDLLELLVRRFQGLDAIARAIFLCTLREGELG